MFAFIDVLEKQPIMNVIHNYMFVENVFYLSQLPSHRNPEAPFGSSAAADAGDGTGTSSMLQPAAWCLSSLHVMFRRYINFIFHVSNHAALYGTFMSILQMKSLSHVSEVCGHARTSQQRAWLAVVFCSCTRGFKVRIQERAISHETYI